MRSRSRRRTSTTVLGLALVGVLVAGALPPLQPVVAVTNSDGSVRVTKQVDGDAPGVDFGFTIDCDDGFADSFRLRDGESFTFTRPSDPYNECTVTETDRGGADETTWGLVLPDGSTVGDDADNPPAVTIVAGITRQLTYINVFSRSEPPDSDFADVADDHPFATEIAWLADTGITTGWPDNTFRPTLPVTRQAMAAFLYRFDGTMDDRAPDPGFTDVADDHPFATEIAWLADTGITTGWPDNTFRPTLPVTRQAMAAFLYRAEELLAPAEFRACLVTDPGGIDDRSFNQTAYQGLLRAEEELSIAIAVAETISEDDAAERIATFANRGCDLIITVGFLLGQVTESAARAAPEQAFAIVDHSSGAELDNLRELLFAPQQAAFLAGYVAAGMTEGGAIGTYGGLDIAPVTAFMDGFLAGASFYNLEVGSDVTVAGWDGSSGVFIGTFGDTTAARSATETLLAAGADIVLPVAGPAGVGTAELLDERNAGSLIWVDTDGYLTLPEYRDLILTSVLKRMDVSIFITIEDLLEERFTGGEYLGTLANEGVGIAPFHTFEAQVPAAIKDRLPELIEGIVAGDISVDPSDY